MMMDAVALMEMGYQARREHRLPEAMCHFADAVELCRNGSEPASLAQALTGLGQIERDLHDLDASLKHYSEAVAIYRTVDDPLVLAHTVRHVADILRNQAKLDLAAPLYDEALVVYRAHAQTSPLDLANAIRGYALLKGDLGETQAAKQLWQEAGQLYAAVGVQAGVDESERQVARLAG